MGIIFLVAHALGAKINQPFFFCEVSHIPSVTEASEIIERRLPRI